MYKKRKRLSAEAYAEGILAGDLVILSKAITLVESALPDDRTLAESVLEIVLPSTGNAVRIGITGVPGVGKSSFIESFGKIFTRQQKKLAVLAIDPSSQRSKGSILGDKTRMHELSADPFAFIRPSPSGNSLGGVTNKTRETMLLCEAAGFNVIFIETVGVGQSETAVHGMVDFFLLLMLAGAGDELQGIKKGIMEMADALVITKADGDNKAKCALAQREYKNALHLFPPSKTGWYPPVLTCSALYNEGMQDVADTILRFVQEMKAGAHFEAKRQRQNIEWMHDLITASLKSNFYSNQQVQQSLADMEARVGNLSLPSTKAANTLLRRYFQSDIATS
jgi:LAO/AO transport system kinase